VVQNLGLISDVADVEQLVKWSITRLEESGELLKYLYKKRIACYKMGELLLDTEYDTMRKGIRKENTIIEDMIFKK